MAKQVQIKHRWSGAVLFTADIPDDTPSGMEMRVALENATRAGADLTDANLARANLAGADLTGANLVGADLVGAKWRDGVAINKRPIQLHGLYWNVTILDAHMQIGCELHTLAEWSAFDDARIVQMDGREALRFWREHKDALLGLARGAGRSFDPVTQDAKQPA